MPKNVQVFLSDITHITPIKWIVMDWKNITDDKSAYNVEFT